MQRAERAASASLNTHVTKCGSKVEYRKVYGIGYKPRETKNILVPDRTIRQAVQYLALHYKV